MQPIKQMQPMPPGTYTLYRDDSGESTQTQDSAFAPAWAAPATAPAKPRHAYVAFQSLPCIPEHLRHSAEWLAEQEILRKISRCILTPGTNESDIIHALKSVEVNYGLVNMSTRMAQPMVVLGAPGAFGGESEMRVTDVLAPVSVMPATAAATTAAAAAKSLEVFSPLHAAVIANKARVAHHLLTGPNGAGSGADVNQRSEWNGRTAIMIAAANGNYDMVDLLLDYDANLLQVDAEGNTALVYAVVAAKVPSAAIVQRLLAECPELADPRALPYAAYAPPTSFWANAMRAVRKSVMRDGGEAALFIVWREMEEIEDALFAACARRGAARRSATISIGSFGALTGRDPRLGAGANFPGLL